MGFNLVDHELPFDGVGPVNASDYVTDLKFPHSSISDIWSKASLVS